MLRYTAGFLLFFALGSCQSVPVYYDIGVVHRPVTTAVPAAQLWYDRGLALTYGFNHEEAIRCFDAAIEADPRCVMAYCGKAFALGPNYNNIVVSPEANQAALATLQAALDAGGDRSGLAGDFLVALGTRYVSSPPEDRAPLEAAFAEAMRGMLRKYPDDPDVAAWTAEALMLLRPWKLWSPSGEPAVETGEIRRVLEEGLARWPRHPALCHLYIHTMEAGPEVAKALPAAETLETLVPGLGHLVHMPSHIYIWTGRYSDSLRVNQMAVEKDRAFAEYAGRKNFYTLYRLHNYHFIAYSAMWTGQREVALAAARQIREEIPPELMEQAIDFLDLFMATPFHVMVRFGMWDAILAEPEPKGELFGTRAAWHYARGIALASRRRNAEASRELASFREARAAVPATRMMFNNPVADILGVADAVLAGEVAYRQGDHERAFELLRQAVVLDRKLNYDEPWGWMEPARHALGALLTEQGQCAEAIEVYRANLERYPENGWALHGLAECLRKTGQEQEAAAVEARFRVAWARSDTEIPGSCFCRSRN